MEGGAGEEEIWFDVPAPPDDGAPDHGPGGDRAPAADPWLAALLPHAMVRGEALRIRAPVDALLLSRAPGLMEVWAGWYPGLAPVPVEADGTAVETDRTAAGAKDGDAVAAMFSGGVDSLFTVLRDRAPVGPEARPPEDLILVHGFDIPLSEGEGFERAERLARTAAERAGRRLLTASTNLRETRWEGTPWGWLGHGAALAAAALAVGGHRTVYVPATGGYRDLHPWGSHPLTDRLFSTSRTAFVHDGAASTRTEKLALLSSRDAALESLRVCWESRAGRNCGACPKCLRTALALELLGALGRCATLHGPVALDRVARLPCRHSWDYREMADLRALAVARGRPDAARALSRAIARARRRGRLREWGEALLPWRRPGGLYRERRPWQRWVGGRGRGPEAR